MNIGIFEIFKKVLRRHTRKNEYFPKIIINCLQQNLEIKDWSKLNSFRRTAEEKQKQKYINDCYETFLDIFILALDEKIPIKKVNK